VKTEFLEQLMSHQRMLHIFRL